MINARLFTRFLVLMALLAIGMVVHAIKETNGAAVAKSSTDISARK